MSAACRGCALCRFWYGGLWASQGLEYRLQVHQRRGIRDRGRLGGGGVGGHRSPGRQGERINESPSSSFWCLQQTEDWGPNTPWTLEGREGSQTGVGVVNGESGGR